MKALSENEKKVYDFICESFASRGFSPSVRDIRDAVGVSSTATVYGYIEKLTEKGYLVREAGKSRTLRPRGVSGVYKVPLIGKVTAGSPIYAFQDDMGTVSFAADAKYDPESLFALKIRGTSMTGAGIMDGDIVIVNKCDTCDDGEIVVALIDDEATVKTLYREHDRIRLQPENPEYDPIYSDHIKVLGKIVACMRYY